MIGTLINKVRTCPKSAWTNTKSLIHSEEMMLPQLQINLNFSNNLLLGLAAKFLFEWKTAEEQRKSQRGLDSDSDGWSDEEVATIPIQNIKPEVYVPAKTRRQFKNL